MVNAIQLVIQCYIIEATKRPPPPKKSKRFDKSMTIDTTFSISIVVYMKKNCGFCLEFSLNLNKRYRFTCYVIALDVIDTFLTSLMPYLLIFLLYNRPDRTNDTRGPAQTTIHRSTYSINSRFSSSSRYFFHISHISCSYRKCSIPALCNINRKFDYI